MDVQVVVRDVAARLDLLDAEKKLVSLDSLEIVDLVMELEGALGVEIPVTALRQESFASVEAIAALLEGLRPAK